MIYTKLYEDIALKWFCDFAVSDRNNFGNAKTAKTAKSVKLQKCPLKTVQIVKSPNSLLLKTVKNESFKHTWRQYLMCVCVFLLYV